MEALDIAQYIISQLTVLLYMHVKQHRLFEKKVFCCNIHTMLQLSLPSFLDMYMLYIVYSIAHAWCFKVYWCVGLLQGWAQWQPCSRGPPSTWPGIWHMPTWYVTLQIYFLCNNGRPRGTDSIKVPNQDPQGSIALYVVMCLHQSALNAYYQCMWPQIYPWW